MDRIEFKWTDGNNEDFQQFYIETEKYYSQIVGGVEKRAGFVPIIYLILYLMFS